MKNKEIENIIKQKGLVFYTNGWVKNFFEVEINFIVAYIEQLEKELELKDKALDKACKKLSDEVYVESIDGYLDVEEWKEWCENE